MASYPLSIVSAKLRVGRTNGRLIILINNYGKPTSMFSTSFSMHLNTSLYLANAGIPLFTQSVFYQIILLIPIIAIEAYIHKKLLNLSILKAIFIAFITNIISTIGGGFIILCIGAFIGHIVFHTTVPVQPGSFPFLPLEIMITLIPMFFFSVYLESLIGSWGVKKIEKSQVNKSFFIANLFTYLMLEILAFTQLVKGYIEGRG
ncbi:MULTISPECIES: hypothetical protein [unclassified Microcoleus]|uniref:hypothetical protein n=2 Tax=unclassified Microcoleus TaxID=2642155 RepID=UPI002FCF4BB3